MADFYAALRPQNDAAPLADFATALNKSPRLGIAVLSLTERIEIDFAELRQDHRVLKLARRRIAAARERQGTRVFERKRASPAFGHNRAHDLLSFTGLQVAFRVPIESDDDVIGHRHFQAGFKFSAEDFPMRLSATTS